VNCFPKQTQCTQAGQTEKGHKIKKSYSLNYYMISGVLIYISPVLAMFNQLFWFL